MVQQLLAGLPGPYGNEHLWALVRDFDGVDLFDVVFAFLTDCGVVDSASRFGDPPQAAQNAAELCHLVWELDQDTALAVLAKVASRTLAYRVEARYSPDKAEAALGRLAALLGPETSWWSNTQILTSTSTSWNPVTQHTFDALVNGASGGVVVAVLAVDED